ncbi:MAG: DUF1289 domain-containing protein [Marinobacter sp.]
MKVVDKVRSPCISVCALDESDICIGCQRTSDEIFRWTTMTNDERREVLLKVAEREKKLAL